MVTKKKLQESKNYIQYKNQKVKSIRPLLDIYLNPTIFYILI